MSFNEWKNVKLQDIVTRLGDGLHGTPKYDNDGKYFFINGNNLVDGKIVIKDSTKRVAETEYLKYRKELNDRTILLGINGTIGNVAIYNNEKCILGKSACYFNVTADVSKNYIKYIVVDKNFQEYIQNFASGTTIKNVSLKLIRDFEFKLPPLPIQERIASILSSLDDKIELNRQTNQTLEAIAQALFKEWFVDFNFPGAAGEMQESELGEIPIGWKVGKLNEVLQVKYGKDHKHLESGKIPVYGSGGIMRFANKSLYEKESILIPRKGTLSNLFYINKPFWSVDTMFYTKIKLANGGKYLFHLLLSSNLASMNVGSAVPSLTTEILNNIPVLIPTDEILAEYEKVVSSLFNQTEQNIQANQTLADLRNSLLPKLMKGEIKINYN